jgi:hypothetical protein
MKMILGKTSIEIIPDTEQDEVYLEAILGLHKAGDKADAIRIPPMGLEYSWAYLEIRKRTKGAKP